MIEATINWLSLNKEWIFGGIGVFVISLIIAIISRLFNQRSSTNTQVQKGGKNSTNVQIGNNLNIEKSKFGDSRNDKE